MKIHQDSYIAKKHGVNGELSLTKGNIYRMKHLITKDGEYTPKPDYGVITSKDKQL